MREILWGIILPFVGFLILAIIVAINPVALPWDTTFLLFLHRYATPEFNKTIAIATNFGTYLGVLPASVAIIAMGIWHHRWRITVYFAVAMLGSVLINPIAKNLWQRARPALWEGIPRYADFSFPSGHAMHSMTFVVALVILSWHHPRRNLLLILGSIFAVFIAFTRVYLGVHYPSDVLGGWLLAIAWTVGLSKLLLRPGDTKRMDT